MLDLSQNVDRDDNGRSWGIVGCMTPTGMPYLTTRGGPVTGPESLALQGIPTEKLSLAHEDSRKLQNFAGNAMTSTVVGAAILAALACGFKILDPCSTDLESRDIEMKETKMPLPLEELIKGRSLERIDLSNATPSQPCLEGIPIFAGASMQLCSCEGQFVCSTVSFQECPECGHITCIKCGLNPLHKYKPLPPSVCAGRKDPSKFRKKVWEGFPLQLSVSSLKQPILQSTRASSQPGIEYMKAMTAIRAAVDEVLYLLNIRRGHDWTVVYESSRSRLELVFRRKWNHLRPLCKENGDDVFDSVAQWHLYAKPEPTEPASSLVREMLARPFARMTCFSSPFQGGWQIHKPENFTFVLNVKAGEERVDSWEKKQGLQDPMFCNRQVWKRVTFTSKFDSDPRFPTEILGTYELLQDCGTACGSLHRKLDPEPGQQPMFFFLDPHPLQNATEDSMVFASAHHRLSPGETRDVFATAKPGWRIDAGELTQELECQITGCWEDCPTAKLAAPILDSEIERWMPISQSPPQISLIGCDKSSFTALVLSFALRQDGRVRWRPGNIYELDLANQPAALGMYTGLLQRASQNCNFHKLMSFPVGNSVGHRCITCAPSKPLLVPMEVESTIKPGEQTDGNVKYVEHVPTAVDFEKRIKERPPPIVARLHCHDTFVAIVLEVNVLTLVHRVIAKVVRSSRNVDPPQIEWRLARDHGFDIPKPFPRIPLSSNEDDAAIDQPPNFREEEKQPVRTRQKPVSKRQTPKTGTKQLFEAQRRSVSWMLKQESPEADPWIEQEIEEVCIPSASLRLEVIAKVKRLVRGGVLADEVGYGKTITTLGLIDADARGADGRLRLCSPTFVDGDTTIPLGSTLIIVPQNLVVQWRKEIATVFANYPYMQLTVANVDQLKALSIAEFKSANIILTTWEVFEEKYFDELAYLCQMPRRPQTSATAFEQWMCEALDRLGKLVNDSNGCKQDNFWTCWEVAESNREQHEKLTVPSKRGNKAAVAPKGQKRSASEIEPEVRAKRLRRSSDDICPLLHLFSFHRVVIDEFTYVSDEMLGAILHLTAPRKWILSGTPPLESFCDINLMAQFLGTKLSSDDEAGETHGSCGDLDKKMRDKTRKSCQSASCPN